MDLIMLPQVILPPPPVHSTVILGFASRPGLWMPGSMKSAGPILGWIFIGMLFVFMITIPPNDLHQKKAEAFAVWLREQLGMSA